MAKFTPGRIPGGQPITRTVNTISQNAIAPEPRSWISASNRRAAIPLYNRVRLSSPVNRSLLSIGLNHQRQRSRTRTNGGPGRVGIIVAIHPRISDY